MNNDLINRWAYLFQKLSMGSSPISFEQGTKFLTKSSVNIKSLIVPEPLLGVGRENYFMELSQRKSLAVAKLEKFVHQHSPQTNFNEPIVVSPSPVVSATSSPIKQPESEDETNSPVETPMITPVDTPINSAPQSPAISRNNSPSKQSLPPLPLDPFAPFLPAMNDGTKNSPRSVNKNLAMTIDSPRNHDDVHLSDVSLKFGDA